MHCSVRTWELWVKISPGPHPPYCHGGRGVSHSCLSESDSWRGNGVAGNPLFLIRSISQWWAQQVYHRPLNLIMVPWEQSGCHNTRISNSVVGKYLIQDTVLEPQGYKRPWRPCSRLAVAFAMLTQSACVQLCCVKLCINRERQG